MALEFPISGDVRFPLLLLEWITAFTCLELGLVFFLKYKRFKGEKYSDQELGIGSLFVGFSLLWYFFIFSDYYANPADMAPYLIWSRGNEKMFFTNFGYFSLNIGVFLFIFFMERNNIYFKKFLFTIIYSILTVIYFIAFFIDLGLTRNLSSIFYPVFIIFLIVFFLDLIRKMQGSRDVPKLLLAEYLGSFFGLIIGFIFTFNVVVSLFGTFYVRLIGSCIQLGSFLLLFVFFLKLPPLSLLKWRELIENVYILDKAGVCLFQKNYAVDESEIDDNLVTSALTTVSLLMQEMMDAGEEGISSIKKKGKIITLYSGKVVNGAVITEMDNKQIGYNLKNVIDTFEAIYYRIIIDWDGDNTVFKPVEQIIDTTFSTF